ncbi:hypothetical protein HK405_006947, partial [Cladochytrium tenue]
MGAGAGRGRQVSGSDSLVEILRRRQQADFVGRDGQLGLFRENLRLAPDDRRKRFVFNIHGDGGGGKTFLLQQLRRVARDEGALDAYTDEDVFGIPETMVALAGQLGKPFADFLGRYEEFDRRREQMAQDPQAPLTAWSKVTRAAVKIGLHASKALPGAAPIVDLLDPQSAAEAADQVRVYLSGKFTDSRDVRLLLDPVRELSPVFVQCLRKAAARQPVAFPPKTPKTAPHLVSPRAQHHNELGRGRGGSRAWRHHAEGYSHRGLPSPATACVKAPAPGTAPSPDTNATCTSTTTKASAAAIMCLSGMLSGSDSLVEILRRRQQADFVGRDGQLGLFRENLRLAPDDRRKRFVFNIHGDGGVGKTFLLQQLRRVARDEGALDAYTDEDVFGIPETMVALAGQLGKPFADFLGRYEEFDRRREQMAQDPQAPLTAWSKVTRAAVKIGLHASKALPGAAPIVDLLDPQSAAEAADQVRVYLSGKFTDSRDVRLLLDPVRELSPVFVQCLRKAAARQP